MPLCHSATLVNFDSFVCLFVCLFSPNNPDMQVLFPPNVFQTPLKIHQLGLKTYAHNWLCPVTYRQYKFKDVLVIPVSKSDNKSKTSVGRE